MCGGLGKSNTFWFAANNSPCHIYFMKTTQN